MPDTPDLLVPDRRVVSIEEAKREKARRSTGSANDFVTRKELIAIVNNLSNGIGMASAHVGEQVYEAIGEKTAEHLRAMEQTLRDELHREFERRSVRGRVRALREAVRGYLARRGLLSAVVTAPALVERVGEEGAAAT